MTRVNPNQMEGDMVNDMMRVFLQLVKPNNYGWRGKSNR